MALSGHAEAYYSDTQGDPQELVDHCVAPAKRDRLARAVDKKFAHDRPTGHIDPLWVAPVIGITFRPSGLHSRNFLFGSAEGKQAGLVERRSRATLERITAQ